MDMRTIGRMAKIVSDFIITWVIVIRETASFVSPKGLTFLSNGEWIRYLLIERMLCLIRLLMHVRRYRAFVATFLTLIPSLMPYLGTIFNFNDYPSGMVTLYNLLVMGNWQAWMQSYKELTNSAWTCIYFVSFYLITILLLLNLIVVFVLEAFFAEMELEDSMKCEEQDKESGGKDRPRYVGTKTRNQRVGTLLHHMLSSELNHTQCSTPYSSTIINYQLSVELVT